MNDEKAERIVSSLLSVKYVLHLIRGRSRKTGKRSRISEPDYWIMSILQDGSLPISEIGRRLQKSKQNMTVLIDKLIEEGKVRRFADKKDRRIVRIELTAKGKNFLSQSRSILKTNIKRNVTALNKSDVDTLCISIENLSRIAKKIVVGENSGKN
jgi:DNA-binding MarR family transcriptional regulator